MSSDAEAILEGGLEPYVQTVFAVEREIAEASGLSDAALDEHMRLYELAFFDGLAGRDLVSDD